MGFLTGGNQQTTTPVYGSIQVQTASNALPIPIVYGVNKIAPNIIWNGGFYGVPASGKGSSGGKGAAFGKGQNAQDYYCAIILGICEGPISEVSNVWDNSTITVLGYVTTMYSPYVFAGYTPQEPWSELQEDYPSQAIGYPGVALVADYKIALGESATLDSYSFEVHAVLQGTAFNEYDADPALVIQDFLTNPQYGVGFPASSIDTSTLIGSSGDSSYQSYCKASNLALSPALTDQESASSILARWLQLTNTAAVWSGGRLKFIPYGDTSLTGGTFTGSAVSFGTNNASQSYTSGGTWEQVGTYSFTPDVTPIYNLTDDDFVAADDDDPVQVQRTDPYEAYNYQSLEICQRTNFYDATPVDVWDQNAIDTYGLRKASTVTAHEICDPTIAQNSAQLILQRGLYIRNHYTFKLSWEYCLLEPMDLVTITDEYLGLDNTVVRITDISEDDDGILSVTAEEFPNGVATAVQYPVQVPSGTGLAVNAVAAPINAPIIFEPPYALAGELAVWIGISPQQGTGSWGGCNVFLSVDGDSYAQIGTFTGASVMGKTTNALPAISTGASTGVPDEADTLSVNLTESDGTLASVSYSSMIAGASACFIGTSADGEILGFETATLTSAGKYGLQPLVRGLFGSEIIAAPAGSPFLSLSGAVLKQAFQPTQVGQTVYFKFQSFNVFGSGAVDLDSCTEYTYTITGEGLAGPVAVPQNLRLSFTAQFAILTWDTVTDERGAVQYYVLRGSTAADAQIVDTVAQPSINLLSPDTYYVEAFVTPLPNLTVASAPSAGIVLNQNMLVTNELDSVDEQQTNWAGPKVNFATSGTSPDEILLLGTAASVDYGLIDGTIGAADDFGTLDATIVTPLDLGSIT